MSEDAGVKRETVDDRFGYVYVSGNGQMVVDIHASDEEHLLALPTRVEQPLYDCRFYLRDVVPEGWRGKLGRLVVTREVGVDGSVTSVRLEFTPIDAPAG